MTKWTIEGSLIVSPRGTQNPRFICEPFLTEVGARSFAAVLNKEGYAVTVRTAGKTENVQTIAGRDLIKWLNAGSL